MELNNGCICCTTPNPSSYHPETESFFVSFPFANSVGRFGLRDSELPRFVSAHKMGLTTPRGLAVHPGDPCVYVAGQHEGMARLDARTLEVVERIETPTGSCTHVYCV